MICRYGGMGWGGIGVSVTIAEKSTYLYIICGIRIYEAAMPR